MLHCKAKGLGTIKYRWFRSDTKEGRLKPVYQSKNEWFLIDCLTQKHCGYYVCHAENEYEYAASRRVHISAHLPTAAILIRETKCMYNFSWMNELNSYYHAVMQPLIKILKQPWSQLIPKGGQFHLLCEAISSGGEQLHYQWYFSGKPIAGATESEFIRYMCT